MGKQSQVLLQPTEVESGLQVGVEFESYQINIMYICVVQAPNILHLACVAGMDDELTKLLVIASPARDSR